MKCSKVIDGQQMKRWTCKCKDENIDINVEENWCKGKTALKMAFSQM